MADAQFTADLKLQAALHFQVLAARHASSPWGWIAVIPVDDLDLALNFMCWARAGQFNNYVFVASTSALQQRLAREHAPVVELDAVRSQDKHDSSTGVFGAQSTAWRLNLVHMITQLQDDLHLSVIVGNAASAWTRSPFTHIAPGCDATFMQLRSRVEKKKRFTFDFAAIDASRKESRTFLKVIAQMVQKEDENKSSVLRNGYQLLNAMWDQLITAVALNWKKSGLLNVCTHSKHMIGATVNILNASIIGRDVPAVYFVGRGSAAAQKQRMKEIGAWKLSPTENGLTCMLPPYT